MIDLRVRAHCFNTQSCVRTHLFRMTNMTQHESAIDAAAPAADTEDIRAIQDDPRAPRLSKRAREALKRADPLTESLLAKVLGNQVCMQEHIMQGTVELTNDVS